MPEQNQTRRGVLRGLAGVTALATIPVGTTLGQTADSNYKDEDNNGYPDEGEVVTGAYKAVYAYDASGDYYFDLGDGRVRGTVDSIDELDQDTLTVCDYKVQYRGKFQNDPYLDTGWVKNEINCTGYDDNSNRTFIAVHETDPRYTGNGESIWSDWEYHVDARKKEGNVLTRPENPPNQS